MNKIYCYIVALVLLIVSALFCAFTLRSLVLGNPFLFIVGLGFACIFGVASADMYNKGRSYKDDLDDPQEPTDL